MCVRVLRACVRARVRACVRGIDMDGERRPLGLYASNPLSLYASKPLSPSLCIAHRRARAHAWREGWGYPLVVLRFRKKKLKPEPWAQGLASWC